MAMLFLLFCFCQHFDLFEWHGQPTRWSYSAIFLPVPQARIFSGLAVKN
jgi:hypothetical protein